MWNPVREAEKQARRAVSKIVNPAVDACKRGMNKLGDQLRSSIRSTAQNAEAGLKRGSSTKLKAGSKALPMTPKVVSAGLRAKSRMGSATSAAKWKRASPRSCPNSSRMLLRTPWRRLPSQSPLRGCVRSGRLWTRLTRK